MFGSDWPVCRPAGGWNRRALTVGELLDDLTAAQAEAVLAGTASSVQVLSLCAPVGASGSGRRSGTG
jgi:hypothetical protein